MNNRWRIFLLVIFLIAFSFFREFVFLNVNEQSRVTFYHDNDSHVSPFMHFLSVFSYPQLYYGKWLLTLLFSTLFMWISCIIIRLLFNNPNYIRWTIFTYVSVFLLSFLFYLAGWLFHFSGMGYTFARAIIGIAESPVILMVLVPSFKLMEIQPE